MTRSFIGFCCLVAVLFSFIGSSWFPTVRAEELPKPPKVTQSDNLPVPEVEDDRLRRIIDGLVFNIRNIFNEGSIRKIMSLLRELMIILGEYFGMIDEQIKSSDCHNRDCSSHGNVTPTPSP